jgi:UDP-N-acetylglucosamine--N-acetylmuramyl-(pentapeptide) pyrophosphoryl-undecaprenol N-acetylglucosamine transferase
MAISEICVIAKPAIFVPYPHAAEDHQTFNAMNLQTKEAGIMIPDAVAGKELVDAVIGLVNDRAKRETLARNIAPLGVRDADEVIADTILNQLGK